MLHPDPRPVLSAEIEMTIGETSNGHNLSNRVDLVGTKPINPISIVYLQCLPGGNSSATKLRSRQNIPHREKTGNTPVFSRYLTGCKHGKAGIFKLEGA